MKALQDGLRRMQASHKQAEQNLAKTSQNLTHSLAAIDQIQKDTHKASDKYIFVQKLRTYVADLCDCLQHKSVIVEELEDHLIDLRGDRAAAERDQLQLLHSELMGPAEAAVTAALGVLSRWECGTRTVGNLRQPCQKFSNCFLLVFNVELVTNGHCSTGRPVQVRVRHRNLLNFVSGNLRQPRQNAFKTDVIPVRVDLVQNVHGAL